MTEHDKRSSREQFTHGSGEQQAFVRELAPPSLPTLPYLPQFSSGYESTPTSRNVPRETAPVDGWLDDQIQKTDPAQHPALFPVQPSTPATAGELSTPAELTIRVIGEPVPQGSRLRPWRDAVVAACQSARTEWLAGQRSAWQRHDGPVALTITVFVARTREAGTRQWPSRRLTGAMSAHLDVLLDALTAGAVILEPSRVVRTSIEKRYADGRESGAFIVVRHERMKAGPSDAPTSPRALTHHSHTREGG